MVGAAAAGVSSRLIAARVDTGEVDRKRPTPVWQPPREAARIFADAV
jgi:hypothetical protein